MDFEPEARGIDAWCKAHGISRAMFYKLPAGERPRVMVVGSRRLISREASAEWRRQREAAASTSKQEVPHVATS